MNYFLFLLFIGTTLAERKPVIETVNLQIKKGDVISITSPDYPQVPAAGTRITWYLTGDQDTNLLLICEDLRISPSPGCDKGYFQIYDGQKEEKYCGSESQLTFKSANNQIRIVFDVNWSSGLANCKVKDVNNNDGAKIPIDQNEDDVILLTPESQYSNDAIYISSVKMNTNKIWRFETNKGGSIGFHCTRFYLSDNCERAKIIFTDGNNKEEICNYHPSLNRTSVTNKLTIQLVTTDWDRGIVDCLVQAISGDYPLEYRNIISVEVDSSEYGRQNGPKSTTCNCGWSDKVSARIVNGQQAVIGQYPWVVSLNLQGSHWCGGSIITEYHILTAAHCTNGKSAEQFKVYVGIVDNTNYDRRGQVIQVQQIIEHNYDSLTYHQNDIAVLVLEKEIKFDRHVGRICLPPKRLPLTNKMITVIGWGALLEENVFIYQKHLMRAHMRVVDHKTCSYLWYRMFDTEKPDRVCTWASNRDSCYGDSGGPLVWLDPETNRYTQIGLVSFGRGCNTDFPKVNSDVANYYDWIQQIISRTKPGLKTCNKME